MTKLINAIWLGKKMTPLSFVCIDDWKKQGYDVKLWTEDDQEIINWIESCEFARECYKRKLYAFVTDYLRLKILKEHGGLYLDTDVTIQKDPFPLFENVDFSIGYENEENLGTAIIYSKKESTIVNSIIDFYENDIMSSPLFLGPEIMTNLLMEKKLYLTESCKLYEKNYFYSYQGEALHFSKPDTAYLIHWFQHSWKRDKNHTFLKMKDKSMLGKAYIFQKYLFRFKR